MKHIINIPWFGVRLAIGGLFVLSGSQKLLSHHANFLYVVENYQFLTPFLAVIAAWVVPWLELFLGIFLFSGLWLKWSLRYVMTLTAAFILVVGQAVLRGLPIQECGCFGDFISFAPDKIIIFDICLLSLQIMLLRNLERASAFSLDRLLENS